MITRIIIEHFKSIEYCDLTLGPVNIFVGPNGSGKSNIVDAISFLKDAIEHGLDYAFRERLGYESVRQWSASGDHSIRIHIHFTDSRGRGSYGVQISPHVNRYIVSEEEGIWEFWRNGAIQTRHSFKRFDWKHYCMSFVDFDNIDEHGALEITENNECVANNAADPLLRPIFTDHDGNTDLETISFDIYQNFQGYSKFNIFPNTLRQPQKSAANTDLDSAGEKLYFSFLQMGQNNDGLAAKEKIVHALRLLAPNIRDIRIEELGGFLVPLFEVKSPNGGNGPSGTHTFNVAQVSDGTLRALGLLTVLYHPGRPNMIALEEPEQMLHPGALAVLAEAIKESSETSQIFITTHSPDLIDHFEPESVFAVEMVDGVTKVSGVSQAQVTSVREGLFSLGEMMSMEGIMRDEAAPTSAPAEGDHA